MSGVGLVVYNQRGKVIFETKEYGHNFDMGRLDAGTYYYVLTYPKDGRQQKKKGFVEVVR
ncbi:MAG: gliding motility-associated C-terminal domain-containing protein, partial [Odoribacter sp.]|nr:gliding motility-associated C-terminal domain-containing protein [Odoribacter sp.]